MKTTIVILVILGLVAALCAVLLINALPYLTGQKAAKNPEIEIITTTGPIEPMTILTEEMISTESVLLNEAPQGYFTSPAQIVGKVTAVKLVPGQPITSDKIVRGGTSAELAATIPPGMRAVAVSLSGNQISGGLLYPGCVVDVIVTYALRGTNDQAKGEALSTTLLEKVQVLAVSGQSVIARQEEEESKKPATRSSNASRGGLTVTLLVDTDQAEALQLAVLNGQISLTMRNPSDDVPVDPDATILNRGRLGRLGRLVGTTVATKQPGEMTAKEPVDPESLTDPEPITATEPVVKPSSVQYVPIEELEDSKPWEMTIIRGKEVEIEEFMEPK